MDVLKQWLEVSEDSLADSVALKRQFQLLCLKGPAQESKVRMPTYRYRILRDRW